jgi:hypothetical protein
MSWDRGRRTVLFAASAVAVVVEAMRVVAGHDDKPVDIAVVVTRTNAPLW